MSPVLIKRLPNTWAELLCWWLGGDGAEVWGHPLAVDEHLQCPPTAPRGCSGGALVSVCPAGRWWVRTGPASQQWVWDLLHEEGRAAATRSWGQCGGAFGESQLSWGTAWAHPPPSSLNTKTRGPHQSPVPSSLGHPPSALVQACAPPAPPMIPELLIVWGDTPCSCSCSHLQGGEDLFKDRPLTSWSQAAPSIMGRKIGSEARTEGALRASFPACPRPWWGARHWSPRSHPRRR